MPCLDSWELDFKVRGIEAAAGVLIVVVVSPRATYANNGRVLKEVGSS